MFGHADGTCRCVGVIDERSLGVVIQFTNQTVASSDEFAKRAQRDQIIIGAVHASNRASKGEIISKILSSGIDISSRPGVKISAHDLAGLSSDFGCHGQ